MLAAEPAVPQGLRFAPNQTGDPLPAASLESRGKRSFGRFLTGTLGRNQGHGKEPTSLELASGMSNAKVRASSHRFFGVKGGRFHRRNILIRRQRQDQPPAIR